MFNGFLCFKIPYPKVFLLVFSMDAELQDPLLLHLQFPFLLSFRFKLLIFAHSKFKASNFFFDRKKFHYKNKAYNY